MNPENIIRAFVTVFALTLLIISLLAYRRSKNTKLLIIGSAFVLFFVKGILLSFGLFFKDIEETVAPFGSLFDIGVLIVLFLSTLKR
jgi:hypothetical protein